MKYRISLEVEEGGQFEEVIDLIGHLRPLIEIARDTKKVDDGPVPTPLRFWRFISHKTHVYRVEAWDVWQEHMNGLSRESFGAAMRWLVAHNYLQFDGDSGYSVSSSVPAPLVKRDGVRSGVTHFVRENLPAGRFRIAELARFFAREHKLVLSQMHMRSILLNLQEEGIVEVNEHKRWSLATEPEDTITQSSG